MDWLADLNGYPKKKLGHPNLHRIGRDTQGGGGIRFFIKYFII
jgi:hypothetical protein